MLLARLTAVAAIAVLAAAPAADARKSYKKGIWGPVRVDGVSQFPIYRELGAGVYHTRMLWSAVSTSRPARPRDPDDPAYAWPEELDTAVRLTKRFRMRLAVEVSRTPGWANGGRRSNWAPDRVEDYADFIAAAVKRYPSVRYWVIWGEPTRRANWSPMVSTPHARPLTPFESEPVHRYARLLDAAYGAIKRRNPRARVVGGNSFTSGEIGPRNWIANLRLPSGLAPRMDLYGHNPFTARRPRLSKPSLIDGMADFSDLDELADWIDRDLGPRPDGRPIRLWLGEFLVPTDHPNHEFNYWVSQPTAASWLSSALRITRRWDRIVALNWLSLYDDPPRPRGDETNKGLIDRHGRRKPAFRAFKRG